MHPEKSSTINNRTGERMNKHSQTDRDSAAKESVTVGIVMPIAPIDGCSSEHWQEVKQIIIESIKASEKYEITIKLVSDAEDIGIIQKRIVQNLYTSDIVVCDVSAKNPNVMFELGMRLAFDKPVVIVKDSETGYSFDTGIIEHLEYPRDLRFQRIIEFKQKLLEKTEKTLEISRKTPEASSFLGNFAITKSASIPQKEAKFDEIILEAVSDLQKEIRMLRNRVDNSQISDVRTTVKNLESYIFKYMYENKLTNSDQALDAILNDEKFQIEFMQQYKLSKVAFFKLVELAAIEMAGKSR